jgi:TAP-like protein.
MYLSVQCCEELSFSDPEELASACDEYPRLQSMYYDTCNPDEGILALYEIWNVTEAAPIENEPVISDIPALVLAGEYDPITPPAWGRMVAENLPNSFFFEFPGVGHGAAGSGEECPLNIALEFLSDPTTEPDGSGIAEMDGPNFYVPATEVTLVSFTDETMGITGLIPEGWNEIDPGVYLQPPLGIMMILQQAAPGVEANRLLSALMSQFGLDETPESTGILETESLIWTLYELEVQDTPIDLAIAESGGTAYFILLQSTVSERDFYYSEVFLPAVDALTPT